MSLIIRFANEADIPPLLALNNTPDQKRLEQRIDTTSGLRARSEEEFEAYISQQSLLVLDVEGVIYGMQGFSRISESHSRKEGLQCRLSCRGTVSKSKLLVQDRPSWVLTDFISVLAHKEGVTFYSVVNPQNQSLDSVVKILTALGYEETQPDDVMIDTLVAEKPELTAEDRRFFMFQESNFSALVGRMLDRFKGISYQTSMGELSLEVESELKKALIQKTAEMLLLSTETLLLSIA
jgi:hypothetical protein